MSIAKYLQCRIKILLVNESQTNNGVADSKNTRDSQNNTESHSKQNIHTINSYNTDSTKDSKNFESHNIESHKTQSQASLDSKAFTAQRLQNDSTLHHYLDCSEESKDAKSSHTESQNKKNLSKDLRISQESFVSHTLESHEYSHNTESHRFS